MNSTGAKCTRTHARTTQSIAHRWMPCDTASAMPMVTALPTAENATEATKGRRILTVGCRTTLPAPRRWSRRRPRGSSRARCGPTAAAAPPAAGYLAAPHLYASTQTCKQLTLCCRSSQHTRRSFQQDGLTAMDARLADAVRRLWGRETELRHACQHDTLHSPVTGGAEPPNSGGDEPLPLPLPLPLPPSARSLQLCCAERPARRTAPDSTGDAQQLRMAVLACMCRIKFSPRLQRGWLSV